MLSLDQTSKKKNVPTITAVGTGRAKRCVLTSYYALRRKMRRPPTRPNRPVARRTREPAPELSLAAWPRSNPGNADAALIEIDRLPAVQGVAADAREGNLTPTDAKARQRDPTATRSGRPCSFPSLPVHFSRDPADNGICRRAGPRSRLHLCPRHLAMVISDRAACLVSAFHELSSDPGGDDPMPRHMDRLETWIRDLALALRRTGIEVGEAVNLVSGLVTARLPGTLMPSRVHIETACVSGTIRVYEEPLDSVLLDPAIDRP